MIGLKLKGETASTYCYQAFNTLFKRGYFMVEFPCSVSSSNSTPGVLLADHIAFISIWNSLNDNQKSGDSTKQQKDQYIQDLVNEIITS